MTGTLLTVSPGRENEAYDAIAPIEPGVHDRWNVTELSLPNGHCRANVLIGRRPRKGSVRLDEGTWDARRDPLFMTGLEVVREMMQVNQTFEWDLKPLFRLQMRSVCSTVSVAIDVPDGRSSGH